MRTITQRLRRIAAMLGLTLALTFFIFSSVFAENEVTLPIGGDTCGLIVASVYPSFDGQQTVIQGSSGARTIGAILQKGNDMTVTADSKIMNKELSDFGRLWTLPISGTQAITLTTSSGPDKPWISLASTENLRRLVVSLGNPVENDNVYEKISLQYTAFSQNVVGCIIGAFNADDELPISLIIRVNTIEVSHQKFDKSMVEGVLDLLSFSIPTKPGDNVEIEVSTLDSPNQNRARYFVAALAIRGAIQAGQIVDDDGDGVPNDQDNHPQIKGCFITGAAGPGPYVVLKELTVDVTLTGPDCWGAVFLRHPPGKLLRAEISNGSTVLRPDTEDVCFTFSSLPMSGCDLGKYTQFRFHILPLRAGTHYGWLNLGFLEEAVRFWSYEWTFEGANIFAPSIFR